LFEYDADERLVAVELPAISNPQNANAIERPRYEYAYTSRGAQSLIRDPLGHETRFAFTDRGQQATRTLPLGFGADGKFATGDDPNQPIGTSPRFPQSVNINAQPFTERMTYDNQGRQLTHTSFEGVVTESLYDGYGRMWAMNYYRSTGDFQAGLVSEREETVFDQRGRASAWLRFTAASPTAITANVSAGTLPAFTLNRAEQMQLDDRDLVTARVTTEGTLRYQYDFQGRMTSVAVSESLQSPITKLTNYQYDILGRLTTVTEDTTPGNSSDAPQVKTDYDFDLQGRMNEQSTTGAVTNVNTQYTFNELGYDDTQTDKDASGKTLVHYDYETRTDGKRTSLAETFWLDADADGVVDAGEQKTTTYDWSYDAASRLTDEVIDHWDNTIDRSETFAYDLAGNRTKLSRDNNHDNVIDEIITYGFDANDRLTIESFNDVTAANADTTTSYTYNQTQQS